MERSPRIEPPIVFLRRNGITATITLALDAAAWLEGLYDNLHAAGSHDQQEAGKDRPKDLAEIEALLFRLVEEMQAEPEALSADLREALVSLISRFREAYPSND
jgi:hypothetical protein